MSDEFQCLCHHCQGTAGKPCLNLERTNDREWVIKKLNGTIDALEARVRELEEAMPDAEFLLGVANYLKNLRTQTSETWGDRLSKSADRIEKVMKK